MDYVGKASAATLGFIVGNGSGYIAVAGYKAYTSYAGSRGDGYPTPTSGSGAKRPAPVEPGSPTPRSKRQRTDGSFRVVRSDFGGKSTRNFLPKMPKIRNRKKFFKKTRATTAKRSTAAVVKKQIMSMSDTKHWTVDNNQAYAATLQNIIYSTNINAKILQGTNDGTRVGDGIYMMKLKFRGFYNIPASATGGYTARILVGWSTSDVDIATGPIPTSGGLTLQDVYLPNTLGGNNTAGIINDKVFTVLYDQTIDINSFTTLTDDLQSFGGEVPLNHKFLYRSPLGAASAGKFGKFKNLYMIFHAFKAGGTPGTTATGDIRISYDLAFKDF